ncbi:growth arrest-specific protein 2-like [Pollicipes pollicipes]|uniref:growth arrest-specific protein 2-like n=1 Tax=Pollicipes pollicipes TaxID=41117 RepID=UPI0018853A2D|nr:growth arrest-specific protein 2-like [Pollicipes pollicipes]
MMRRQRCRSWGTLLDAPEERERPPETEVEYVRYLQQKIADAQERHLLPLKEDVTDWLNATLGTDHIDVNNYMAVLDNGLLLCRLAKIIADQAARTHTLAMPAPTFKFRCWDRARSRSFFARDNVYNFLQFCRLVGCQENFLFETDGLVLHTQPRGVLLCLLELGRRSSRYIEPPVLVQLEQEIDEQERLAAARDGSDSGYSDTAQERERSAERDVADARSPRPSSLIPVRRRRSGVRRAGYVSTQPRRPPADGRSR